MVRYQPLLCLGRNRAHGFAFKLQLTLFFFSFFIIIIEGRFLPRLQNSSSTIGTTTEEKMMMRSQIGSRPPMCERRCISCQECEAIQVPANPRIRVAYARGDYVSDYKPMSWKCKCGTSIFNP
ncbi:EPIDERMAL PATTERNING FACTOR-like protein [Drosera capensis]